MGAFASTAPFFCLQFLQKKAFPLGGGEGGKLGLSARALTQAFI